MGRTWNDVAPSLQAFLEQLGDLSDVTNILLSTVVIEEGGGTTTVTAGGGDAEDTAYFLMGG